MLNKNRTELSFVFSLSNGGRNTPLHPQIGVLSKHKEKGAAGDALKLGGVKRETRVKITLDGGMASVETEIEAGKKDGWR